MRDDDKTESDREMFKAFCAMRELTAGQVANAVQTHNEKVLKIVSAVQYSTPLSTRNRAQLRAVTR